MGAYGTADSTIITADTIWWLVDGTNMTNGGQAGNVIPPGPVIRLAAVIPHLGTPRLENLANVGRKS